MDKRDIEQLANQYFDILNESSLSRIWGNTTKHSSGIITSFRDDRPHKTNLENNSKLQAYLRDKGYGVTAVKGTYIENFRSKRQKEEDAKKDAEIIASGATPPERLPEVHVDENSFFVTNLKVEGDDGGELEKVLFKLGEKFDQDSVLIIPVGGKGAYLLGTTHRDNSWLKFGEKQLAGNPTSEKDPKGNAKYGEVDSPFISKIRSRPFLYEDIEDPKTNNGKWSMKLLAAEVRKSLGQ